MAKKKSKKQVKLLSYADEVLKNHRKLVFAKRVLYQINSIHEKIELIESLKKYTSHL